MFPAVAEVVFVVDAKPLAVGGNNPTHLRAERVDRGFLVLPVLAEQLGIAVANAVDLVLVEVGVRPTHRRLDMLVKRVEGAVLDLDSPPDRRPDALERDLELVDLLRSRDASGARFLLRAPRSALPVRSILPPIRVFRVSPGLGSVTRTASFSSAASGSASSNGRDVTMPNAALACLYSSLSILLKPPPKVMLYPETRPS